MDSDLVYLYLQMQADEEDDLDDQEERVAAAALRLLIAVEVEKLRGSRARHRNPSQLYLCHACNGRLLWERSSVVQARASHRSIRVSSM